MSSTKCFQDWTLHVVKHHMYSTITAGGVAVILLASFIWFWYSRDKAVSWLCQKLTPFFFFLFLSQVYFWLECQYKGRDNTECLWVWWDSGSSDLDWAKLGQYFCSWGIWNTARIPTWQACSVFSSLFCFPNKIRLSYPYILSVTLQLLNLLAHSNQI